MDSQEMSANAAPERIKQRLPKYMNFIGIMCLVAAVAIAGLGISLLGGEYGPAGRYLGVFALLLVVIGVYTLVSCRNAYLVDGVDEVAIAGILGKEKGMRHDEIESFWCSKTRRNAMIFLTSNDVKDMCFELRPYRAPNLFNALLKIAAQNESGKDLERKVRLLGKICSVRVTDEHKAYAHSLAAQAQAQN